MLSPSRFSEVYLLFFSCYKQRSSVHPSALDCLLEEEDIPECPTHQFSNGGVFAEDIALQGITGECNLSADTFSRGTRTL